MIQNKFILTFEIIIKKKRQHKTTLQGNSCILEHKCPSFWSLGLDLRDMTLKYGFNSFLNKMTTVPNFSVIDKQVKYT